MKTVLHRTLMVALFGTLPLAAWAQAVNANKTVSGQHASIGNTREKTDAHTRHADAQWFPEAGLGLFLHWGISSVEGKNISWPMMAMIHDGPVADPKEQERRIRERDYGSRTIVPTDYWAYAERFNPTQYCPEHWLRIAKEAGFQYVVLTAKHHEGFALWPSAYGNFNTKNYMGGRDLVKEYVEACRQVGLKVGLYYSAPDWYFDRDHMDFTFFLARKTNPWIPKLDSRAYDEMKKLKAWMDVNGEAICGVTKLGESESGSFPAVRKGNLRYVFLMPEDNRKDRIAKKETVVFKGIAKPKSVALLSNRRAKRKAHHDDGELVIEVPPGQLSPYVDVLRIETASAEQDYLKAKPEVLEDWKDMRFGMFLCWGPVTLTGEEIGWSRGAPAWGRREGVRGGKGPTPAAIYDELYKKWKPDKFDAEQWVKVAKDAGQKYLIFLVKHHDGFCLYDTKLTDYRSTGPESAWKVDVMKAVADACHKHDLKLILYYSQPDWYHPDYLGPNHERYIKFLHGQIRELLTNYGSIYGLWFDNLRGRGHNPEAAKLWDAENLFKMARQIQPHLIINDRCGLDADFRTPEQYVGRFNVERPWESNITLGTQWAWKPNDKLKSYTEAIRMLAVCASGDENPWNCDIGYFDEISVIVE